MLNKKSIFIYKNFLIQNLFQNALKSTRRLSIQKFFCCCYYSINNFSKNFKICCWKKILLHLQ